MKSIQTLLLVLALLGVVACTSTTRSQPFIAGRPMASPIQYELPPVPVPKAVPITEIRHANPVVAPVSATTEPMLLVAAGESSSVRRSSTDAGTAISSVQRSSDLRKSTPSPQSKPKLLLTGDPSVDQALLEASRIFDGVINSSKN